jgi:POT family proton-dependent oligopeptide transporter
MNVVLLLTVVISVATGLPVLLQVIRHHPKGLMILFFAEMWERFSYYGMRALLIFYFTQHFLFDDQAATSQYGAYTSLVWLAPVIGGFVADRFLGARKATAFGALLLVCGHFLMAVGEGPTAKQDLIYQGVHYAVKADDRPEGGVSQILVGGKAYELGATAKGELQIKGLPANASLPSVLPDKSYTKQTRRDGPYLDLFYLALALIIMGVGFMKGNISATVGALYAKNDPRRDTGFTLYYYGFNLGAFWAASVCGWLGTTFGWWAGFGAAGLGMFIGWLVFVVGRPLLLGKGEPPEPEKLKAPLFGPLNREWIVYLSALLGVVGLCFVVRLGDVQALLLTLMSVAILAYVAWMAITKFDRVERERLMLAVVLVVGATVFWTLYEQTGSSMNLLAERNTDLRLTGHAALVHLFGQTIAIGSQAQIAAIGFHPAHWWSWIDTNLTPSQTQAFDPGFLLLFAPLFAALWGWLGKRGQDPDPMFKFALALVQVGLGFLVLVWGGRFVDAGFRLPLIFLALAYLFHTTGELCLSPVGLSQITKLSPPMIVSTMMAVFFLSNSWGQKIGGWVAGLTASKTVGGQVVDPAASLHTILSVYNLIGWVSVAFGVAFFALSPVIKGWAHGADRTTMLAEETP